MATKTTYKLKEFDSSKAAVGALCVGVTTEWFKDNSDSTNSSLNSNATISNVTLKDSDWVPTEGFLGAGVCQYKDPNVFIFIANSTTYTFNPSGKPMSPTSFGYRLFLAELSDSSKSEIKSVGNRIPLTSKATVEITPVLDTSGGTINDANAQTINTGFEDEGSGGSPSSGTSTSGSTDTPARDPGASLDKPLIIEQQYTTQISESTTGATESTVTVDNLNARDQFATQVLNSMLGRIPNPSGLSDNEMNFYCNNAYEWAANMMAASARARSETIDKTATQSTQTASVGALESNTEKLLNNIVAALERTDETTIKGTGETQTTEHAERVTLKDVTMSDLQALIANQNELINQLRGKTVDTENNNAVSYSKKSPFETSLLEKITNYTTNRHKDTNDASLQTDTVGLSNLIKAIRSISITATGGSSNIDTSNIVTAINALTGKPSTPTYVVIGNGSQGTSSDNPIYISGWPDKGQLTQQELGALQLSNKPNSLFSFNGTGAPGWINTADAAEMLLNYLKSSATNSLHDYVDGRIKAWLQANTSTVTINNTQYRVINNSALTTQN